jgi:2-C-methyl-D-erythritol 4-phosphate cytidylyltransferase
MDTVIVAAAGASTRMKNDTSKIFHEVDGVPVLVRALAPALKIPSIGRVIIAVRLEDEARCRRMLRRWDWGAALVVPGGSTRAESVWRALQTVPSDDSTVVVHDAARPWASESLWRTVMRAARVHGAAVPAIQVVDTLKIVDGGFVESTQPRNPRLCQIQTPQCFAASVLLKAYRRADAELRNASPDDASLVEAMGHAVATVAGETQNRKITFPNDLPPQL